jgi:hypothetical protein
MTSTLTPTPRAIAHMSYFPLPHTALVMVILTEIHGTLIMQRAIHNQSVNFVFYSILKLSKNCA